MPRLQVVVLAPGCRIPDGERTTRWATDSDPGRLVCGRFGVGLLLRTGHAAGVVGAPLRRVAGLASLDRRRAGHPDVRVTGYRRGLGEDIRPGCLTVRCSTHSRAAAGDLHLGRP